MKQSDKILKILFDISLRARLYRAWQENNAVRPSEYTERDLLILEVTKELSICTESELRTIFGLSPATVSESVDALARRGYLKKLARSSADGRTKPFELTATGDEVLARLKDRGANRYDFLITSLAPEEIQQLEVILQKVLKESQLKVEQSLFNR